MQGKTVNTKRVHPVLCDNRCIWTEEGRARPWKMQVYMLLVCHMIMRMDLLNCMVIESKNQKLAKQLEHLFDWQSII